MNDYQRIAAVIWYLDEHATEQPDLETLARQSGLSTFHFHRLFSRWAGITPKDFLQCLTVAHAKDLLRRGQSALATALDTGLSGPGRLHDLCVRLEAASPGEWKQGGAGWTIRFGCAETPFGPCLIAESPRGICHWSFTEDEESGQAELSEAWPAARLEREDTVAKRIVEQVFGDHGGADRNAPLRAYVRGSAFQVRVWRALLRVPPGTLTSYGRLAGAVDAPASARAVGSAVAKNPLAYLIPCHRVIRETGVLGGYRWDPVRKRAMIAWEYGRGSF